MVQVDQPIGAVIEGGAAVYDVLHQGYEMLPERYQDAIKRKFDKIEEVGDELLLDVEDIITHPAEIGDMMYGREVSSAKRHKQVDIDLREIQSLLAEAEEEQKVESADEMSVESVDSVPGYIPARLTRRVGNGPSGSFFKSYPFVNMSYSRKRKRSSRKYITKRGVKALIGKSAGMAPFQDFSIQRSVYAGPTVVSGMGLTPINVYGQTFRTAIEFDGRAAIITDHTSYDTLVVDKNVPGGGTAGNLTAGPNYKYYHKKRKYHFVFHNPMNEIVQAKFWWLIANDDATTNSRPVSVWEKEYQQKSTDSVIPSNAAFLADTTTYPTKYKEWNDRWTILKKVRTLFQPGQTKQMYLKAPSFMYKEADQDLDIVKGTTMQLMIELTGIPTHQNDGTIPPVYPGVSNLVNLTPVALDIIYSETSMVARSVYTDKLEDQQNFRTVVSDGRSLVNENTAAINTT